MGRSAVLCLAGVVLGYFVCGCGGARVGPGDNRPVGGEAVSVGPIEVQAEEPTAISTLPLNSPASAPIGFTVIHGTRIVRLREMGYTRIAFAGDQDGDCEIYTVDADGTNLQKLTNNSVPDRQPAWSPDGTRIAFARKVSGVDQIFVMNADGSGAEKLTANPGGSSMPAWSPDGQSIVYCSATGTPPISNLWTMHADGTHKRQITSLTKHAYHPDWSPDGRLIVFQVGVGTEAEISIIQPDGSGRNLLTSNTDRDYEPVWSPDGRLIAFQSDRDGGIFQIYTMTVDGGNITPLPWPNSFEQSWCPDGRRLALRRMIGYIMDIFVVSLDGKDVFNLTMSDDWEEGPAWCPVPAAKRVLIGGAGSDGGSNPPFGAARPLVVVGLGPDGMASATTIQIAETDWASLKVSRLSGLGAYLVGARILGTNIRQVLEDRGRGLAPRVWQVSGTPNTGGILIYWSAETGKVASVLVTADTALSDSAATVSSGRVIVQGSFPEVYSARDPARNLVVGNAREVVLNSRTGEVMQVR